MVEAHKIVGMISQDLYLISIIARRPLVASGINQVDIRRFGISINKGIQHYHLCHQHNLLNVEIILLRILERIEWSFFHKDRMFFQPYLNMT